MLKKCRKMSQKLKNVKKCKKMSKKLKNVKKVENWLVGWLVGF